MKWRLPLLLAGLWFAGSKLPLARYDVSLRTTKFSGSLRLALVTDTHSSRYGKNQQELIRLIQSAKPDAILLAGDIYDDVRDNHETEQLLGALPKIAPCFYSSGNHDQNSPDYPSISKQLAEFGIENLDGQTKTVKLAGQTITLSGVADPQRSYHSFHRHLKRLPKPEHYHVVLSHRPHYTEHYRSSLANLVVSGHAHGGQWRLFRRGIFSPGQGLFPKYTKGLYQLGRTSLVVSPGLMRNHLPRYFNPPTFVIIDIKGDA